MERRQSRRVHDPLLLGRRAAARARISLPASIDVMAGRLDVTLLNLSRIGAMLAGPELPGPGNDVILKCGGIDVLGTVIWRGAGRCGVTFDELLDEREVVRLRWEGDETARTGVTRDTRQAAAEWALGIAA